VSRATATHAAVLRSAIPRPRRHPLGELTDIHARLHASRPALYRRAASVADLVSTLTHARRRGLAVAVAGGRHAMGGQQFLSGGCVLDMRGLNRIHAFDRERGLITVGAGITWPQLMRGYLMLQAGAAQPWGIRQKQTGADAFTVGGAISANIHGRGLSCPPFSVDVESLQVVTPGGELLTCSREQEAELFSLVVGGYGLCAIIVAATLRLVPRQKVERVATLQTLPELMSTFGERIAEGYTYGDFQFATDPTRPGFLHNGVLSCYRPVAIERPIPADQLRLSHGDWLRLLFLAHVDKHRAFCEFADFYLRSSGQLYWSDTHQLNIHRDDYHRLLDMQPGAHVSGSEMITELYVPRPYLVSLMGAVREDCLRHGVDLIYGTVRLIRRDPDAYLKWAKDDYACVILNLHVDHDAAGRARAAQDFRRLIDRAIELNGSYFLTYHNFARRDQLLACYPEFPAFLSRKLERDPEERLASDWYRHQRALVLAKEPAISVARS
jgi:FAD/FMN-containing dehydrogenase